MIKAIIFDLDGTLLDTLEDLYLAVNHALKTFNLPLRTKEEVRAFVGNGVENLMIRAAGENFSKELLDEFKAYYSVHKNDNTCVYPQIYELLSEFRKRNIAMAVVSNKFDAAVKELAQKFFADTFTCAIGDRDGIARKPAPDSVLEAMRLIGASASETLYVGDSEVDILTAKNACVKCVSVLWGFKDKEFLLKNGATDIVSLPSEILNFLGD